MRCGSRLKGWAISPRTPCDLNARTDAPRRLEAADSEASAARLQDHRADLDCGTDLRLAQSQSPTQQRLRISHANVGTDDGSRCHAAHAQSGDGMKLFKHPLIMPNAVRLNAGTSILRSHP